MIGSHFWHWHSLFFLSNGALITMSPLLKLEIMVSDNSFGGKYFLLKVCLRPAVSILCFLLGMFKMNSECNGKASKVLVMSITFAILGLHGYEGQAVIGLFSFFWITNLRWAYLQNWIKCGYSCIKVESFIFM